MFEIIRPKKDTTIYGYLPRLNSGVDEIIELNTSNNDVEIQEDVSNPVLASRILLDFDNPDENFNPVGITGSGTPNGFAEFGIETAPDPTSSSSVDEGINAFAELGVETAPERPEPEIEEEVEEDFGADVWLRLFFARGQGLPQNYEIQAFPLETEWSEGTGRRNNNPPTRIPANWIENTEYSDWDNRGGDYDSSVVVSETYDIDDSPDLFLKINKLFNDADPNNGILLKRKDEDLNEFSQHSFFSRNTNTVYVPHLLVGTETFSYDVPEDAEEFIETDNMSVFITNLRPRYNVDQKVRFKVRVREKFQRREFLGIRPRERRERREDPSPESFLPPRTLLYQISDRRTGEVIHPFSDPYTVVSYGPDGHYFDIDLSNLFPDRPYEVSFKFVNPDTGNEQMFSPEQTFTLEND